ncbi:hypothetical protein [Pseudovibrio sp. Tun.PSC04-5.I4]|uniref:hypothetical protein n=1 Tax=Pseudovibrio sp. Tun.PSC04-5.I4 TaxID=1798213 RepID=UPI00088892FF|nr:hypothetical protein [Pseudovibrio sp. Tun.PSC04-5.I4]SDR15327.1 hypothetical protein SAMN04515695_3046 [Pseudovibrio sp. Tun.PSC04-5.I4]
MSLTGEITKLIGRADALISTFNGKKKEIEAAVKNAVETIPTQRINLYLDQINGDDTNTGQRSNAPLRSLDKALDLIGDGRSGEIRFLSDYTMEKRRYVTPVSANILIRSSGGVRKLYLGLHALPDEGSDSWDWEVGGLYCAHYGSFSLSLVEMQVIFPSAPAEGTLGSPRYSALIGSNSLAGPTHVAVGLTRCDIVRPADGAGTILGADTRSASLSVQSTTFDKGPMAGNWVAGANADQKPSDLDWILSNLESL